MTKIPKQTGLCFFRMAKDAEDNIRKAVLQGQTLPKEERFDSNCITPGKFSKFFGYMFANVKYVFSWLNWLTKITFFCTKSSVLKCHEIIKLIPFLWITQIDHAWSGNPSFIFLVYIRHWIYGTITDPAKIFRKS